jgi:hypothetical protein
MRAWKNVISSQKLASWNRIVADPRHSFARYRWLAGKAA